MECVAQFALDAYRTEDISNRGVVYSSMAIDEKPNFIVIDSKRNHGKIVLFVYSDWFARGLEMNYDIFVLCPLFLRVSNKIFYVTNIMS